MADTITIISKKRIKVIRDYAFTDRTPDLTKAGAIVSSDALIRVNVLVPVSYQFVEGTIGLDLAVDSENRIYVLDPVKKMVRIFEKNL